MTTSLWIIVRTVIENASLIDPKVINIFDSRETVIGELVKRFIKDNVDELSSDHLKKQGYDLRERLMVGDLNNIDSKDGYKYTISNCKHGKYSYFDENIVSTYI